MMPFRWFVKSMLVMSFCCSPVLFASQAAPKMTVADAKDAKAAETKTSEIEKKVDLVLALVDEVAEGQATAEGETQFKKLLQDLDQIELDTLAPVIVKKFKQGIDLGTQFLGEYNFGALNTLEVGGGDWNKAVKDFIGFDALQRFKRMHLKALLFFIDRRWSRFLSQTIPHCWLNKLPEKYIEKSFKEAAGIIDAKLAVQQEKALWTELVGHVEMLLSYGRVVLIDLDEELDVKSQQMLRFLFHNAIHAIPRQLIPFVQAAVERGQTDDVAAHVDKRAKTSADEKKPSRCCCCIQ
jgi:hypothetical protein